MIRIIGNPERNRNVVRCQRERRGVYWMNRV